MRSARSWLTLAVVLTIMARMATVTAKFDVWSPADPVLNPCMADADIKLTCDTNGGTCMNTGPGVGKCWDDTKGILFKKAENGKIDNYLPVRDGLRAWYDAEDIDGDFATDVTFSVPGTTITEWKDKSGNGHHASATQSCQTAAWGSGTGLYFDGSGTGCTFVSPTGGEHSALSGEFTSFVVHKKQCNAECSLFEWGNNNVGERRAQAYAWPTTFSKTSFLVGDGTVITGNNPPANTVLVHGVTRSSAGLIKVTTNGVTHGSGSPSLSTYTNTALNIGRSSDGTSNPYKGYIAEIVMFDRLLTTDELSRMQSFLSDKWSAA